MLVLSRKKFESIHIGDHVVKVVEIRGDRVRLGITAPESIPILRGELVVAAAQDEGSRTDGN